MLFHLRSFHQKQKEKLAYEQAVKMQTAFPVENQQYFIAESKYEIFPFRSIAHRHTARGSTVNYFEKK